MRKMFHSGEENFNKSRPKRTREVKWYINFMKVSEYFSKKISMKLINFHEFFGPALFLSFHEKKPN